MDTIDETRVLGTPDSTVKPKPLPTHHSSRPPFHAPPSRGVAMPREDWDSPHHVKGLLAAGGAFLLVAAAFLWRELALRPELVLAPVALVATAASLGFRRVGAIGGSIALGCCTLVGAVWYLGSTSLWLLPGLVVCFSGMAVLAVMSLRRNAPESERLVAWLVFAITGLVTSGAIYFQFFTLADTDIVRRIFITLGWLAAGLVLLFVGRYLKEQSIRLAGLSWIATAVLKGLLYDSSHLNGTLRIAGFFAAGCLLVLSGLLVSRGDHAKRTMP
jgi:hypothetical protein